MPLQLLVKYSGKPPPPAGWHRVASPMRTKDAQREKDRVNLDRFTKQGKQSSSKSKVRIPQLRNIHKIAQKASLLRYQSNRKEKAKSGAEEYLNGRFRSAEVVKQLDRLWECIDTVEVVTKLTPRSAFIHMDDEVVLSFVTMHTFVRVMWRIVKLLDSSAEDKKDYWDERAVRCWEDATEVDDEAPGCKRLPTINYVVQLFDKLVHIDGERRLDDEELCHYLKTAYSALIHVEDVKKVKRNVRDRVKMRDLDRRMSKRLTGMGLEVAEETEEEKKSTEKEFEQSMPDQFWLFPDDIVFGGYKTDLFDRRHPKPPTPPPASQPPLGAAVGFMQRLNMLDDGWQNANDVLYSERGDHLGVLPFDGVSQEGATGRGHSSSVGGSRRKRKGTLLRNGSSGRRPSSAQSSVRGRRVEGEDGVAAANTTSTEEADSQRGKVLNRSRSASCVGKFSRKPSLIQRTASLIKAQHDEQEEEAHARDKGPKRPTSAGASIIPMAYNKKGHRVPVSTLPADEQEKYYATHDDLSALATPRDRSRSASRGRKKSFVFSAKRHKRQGVGLEVHVESTHAGQSSTGDARMNVEPFVDNGRSQSPFKEPQKGKFKRPGGPRRPSLMERLRSESRERSQLAKQALTGGRPQSAHPRMHVTSNGRADNTSSSSSRQESDAGQQKPARVMSAMFRRPGAQAAGKSRAMARRQTADRTVKLRLSDVAASKQTDPLFSLFYTDMTRAPDPLTSRRGDLSARDEEALGLYTGAQPKSEVLHAQMQPQVKVLSRGAPLVQTNTTGHMFAQSGVVERPETPASVIQRSQSVRGHDVVYSSPQQRPTTASPSLRALRGSASSSGLQRRRPQTAIVRNASHQQPRMSVTHTHASQSSNVMVITDDKEESSVVSPPPAARGAVIKHKSTRALARPMSAPAVKVNKMKQLSLSSVEPPENVNLKNQAARFWRPSLSQSIIAQRSDVPHVQKGRAQRPKTAGLLRGNNGRNVAVPHVHSGRAKSVNKTFNGATMVKEGKHYTYTYQPKRDPKDSDMVPSTHSTQLPPHYLAINIQGLKCKGCASGVTAALKRLAFVVDVQIHVYTFKRTQTAYSLHSKAQERTKEARAIDTEAYAHACDVCVDPSTNLHANVEANSMVEKTDSVCLVVGTQDMMLESSFDHVMQTVYHAGRFFPKLRAHGNWNNVPVQSTFAEWLYARHWPMHTPSTFPELWACQFCSFSNDYTLKHCAICQMPAKSTVELKAMLADDLRKEVLMREADRYGIDMLCEFDPADEFSESSETQTSSEEEEEEEEDELGDETSMQSNQELQASTPKPSACRNPVYNPMQIAPTPRLTTDALIPTHTYADDKKSYYLTEEDLALRDSSRSSNHEVEKQNASDVAGLRAGDLESDMHMVNRSMSPLDHALAEAVFTPEEMRPPTATSQPQPQPDALFHQQATSDPALFTVSRPRTRRTGSAADSAEAHKAERDDEDKAGDKPTRTRVVSLQQLSLYVLLMEQLQCVDLDVLMRRFSEEVNDAEERLYSNTPRSSRGEGDTGDAVEQDSSPQPRTNTHGLSPTEEQEGEEGHAASEKMQKSPDPGNTDSDLVFNAFQAAVCGQLSAQGTSDAVQEKVVAVLRSVYSLFYADMSDSDYLVSFLASLSLVCGTGRYVEKLRKAFYVYDHKGDGFIKGGKLKSMLRAVLALPMACVHAKHHRDGTAHALSVASALQYVNHSAKRVMAQFARLFGLRKTDEVDYSAVLELLYTDVRGSTGSSAHSPVADPPREGLSDPVNAAHPWLMVFALEEEAGAFFKGVSARADEKHRQQSLSKKQTLLMRLSTTFASRRVKTRQQSAKDRSKERVKRIPHSRSNHLLVQSASQSKVVEQLRTRFYEVGREGDGVITRNRERPYEGGDVVKRRTEKAHAVKVQKQRESRTERLLWTQGLGMRQSSTHALHQKINNKQPGDPMYYNREAAVARRDVLIENKRVREAANKRFQSWHWSQQGKFELNEPVKDGMLRGMARQPIVLTAPEKFTRAPPEPHHMQHKDESEIMAYSVKTPTDAMLEGRQHSQRMAYGAGRFTDIAYGPSPAVLEARAQSNQDALVPRDSTSTHKSQRDTSNSSLNRAQTCTRHVTMSAEKQGQFHNKYASTYGILSTQKDFGIGKNYKFHTQQARPSSSSIRYVAPFTEKKEAKQAPRPKTASRIDNSRSLWMKSEIKARQDVKVRRSGDISFSDVLLTRTADQFKQQVQGKFTKKIKSLHIAEKLLRGQSMSSLTYKQLKNRYHNMALDTLHNRPVQSGRDIGGYSREFKSFVSAEEYS